MNERKTDLIPRTPELVCGACGAPIAVEGGRVWPCVRCLAAALENGKREGEKEGKKEAGSER
jgi:hypothetical protein